MALASPIQVTNFRELERWDVKYFTGRIVSKYPLVALSEIVYEHNEKMRPSEYPDQSFKILGVNNTSGIFHAYDTLGKKIKQPYKKVSAGDFAYNPYRINVGSIGLVPDEHGDGYISPAYVVFGVDKTKILPEMLLFILKSDFFNKSLRAATAGSVRMNLTYPLLQILKIPNPDINKQFKILKFWQTKEEVSSEFADRAKSLPDILENNVLTQLGLKKKKRLPQPKIMSPGWVALNKWNQRATHLFSQVPDLSNGKYPVARGFDCIDEVKHGCSASPSRKPTSLFVLKLSAVTSGLFQPLERKFIENKKQFRETFSLRKNDILICRTNGTLSFVGRPVKIDKVWSELIFPDKLMRIRCNKRVLPDFLTYMLTTSIVRPQIEAYARTAVGNYAIGNEDVFNLYFPLPPISVQQELIDVISERQNEYKEFKEKAESIREASQREIEQMILGLRPVEDI